MRACKVVDVFTTRPLLGNPVAVVLDAEGLDTEAMQAIARWTNLSETTFLLPPERAGADYRLRIFTPAAELPFAGHPTLGSAHAALEAGRVTPRDGRLVQDCAAGLVTVTVTVTGEGADRRLTLDLPPAKVTLLTPTEVSELDAVLGRPVLRTAPPARIDVGPVWIVAELADAAAVIGLEPDLARSAALERSLGATGVTVFGRHAGGDADIEVRSFAPSSGIAEDPVCGSGNGCVAVFRRHHGQLPAGGTSWRAAQGRRCARDGQVAVAVEVTGRIGIGGACVTTFEGRLNL
jgi:PhzF family phenazine biosynthesis protein